MLSICWVLCVSDQLNRLVFILLHILKKKKINFFKKLKLKMSCYSNQTFASDKSSHCSWFELIAIYCVILFISSLIFNSLILFAYMRQKKLNHTFEFLMVTMALLNITSSLLHLPIIILSNFNCR